MIIIPATGSNPRTSTYWHTKSTVKSLKSYSSNFVDCCFCTCESVIPAFAYLDDPDNKEFNDIFPFLVLTPTDSSVVATLTNLDTGVEYPIIDGTYGIFYEVDVLKDNVWGFILKWSLVATEIGYGNYQMNIQVLDLNDNVVLEKDYPKCNLLPYTCENAHGTVRIESWNSGYVEGGFDYRGISIDNPFTSVFGTARKLNYWIQQIRYYGRLERTKPSVQIDNHYDNQRNLTQVQTQIQREWQLRLDSIKEDISEDIIYSDLLADFIYVSDYNANSIGKYREIKVSLVDVDSENFLNKTNQFVITLTTYKQNNLKRHS